MMGHERGYATRIAKDYKKWSGTSFNRNQNDTGDSIKSGLKKETVRGEHLDWCGGYWVNRTCKVLPESTILLMMDY